MSIGFRVDASAEIGTGHLSRCMTLADAMRHRGVPTVFLARLLPDHFRTRLEARGHEVLMLEQGARPAAPGNLTHSAWLGTDQGTDARQATAVLGSRRLAWLVVDSYALDRQWETAMRPVADRIMVIDDLADRVHDCDILLDQNHYRDSQSRYDGKVPPGCQLLLGPRYALLRDEFRQWRLHVTPRTGAVSRILVFFGGADAQDFTSRTLAALAGLALTAVDVDVVIGAAHPHRAWIEEQAARLGYECHVQTERMAELMAAADLAIGAGGSATWERCCMGLPTLAFSTAHNQDNQVVDAAAAGLVHAPRGASNVEAQVQRHLSVLMDSPQLLQCISETGMRTVDGRGTIRVLSLLGAHAITMREASAADARALFTWRNHPEVRRVSRNTEVLAWEEHERWLKSLLNDPNRVLLVGEHDGAAVGVVRFDIRDDAAEVSIYVVPGKREPGLGRALLHSAEQWLAGARPTVTRLRAEVLGSNVPSHALFTGAGYHVDSTAYSKRVVIV